MHDNLVQSRQVPEPSIHVSNCEIIHLYPNLCQVRNSEQQLYVYQSHNYIISA